MVDLEVRTAWWCSRCQAMVSGPASSPASVSCVAELEDQRDDGEVEGAW